MAIATNTALTYSGEPGFTGFREDLSDFIYMLSPVETPFMSNIGRGKCSNTLFEWQIDELEAADDSNAHLQGDVVDSFDAVAPTARLNNRTQISRKTVSIAGTTEAMDHAGFKSMLARQLWKKGKELKRDIESILLANQAATVGDATTAPTTASVLSWIHTNVDEASDGDSPTGDGSDTRTDGTARDFAESQLVTVLTSIFENCSDEPDVLMVPPLLKPVASAFEGNAEKHVDVKDKRLVTAIDIYVGDFSTVRIIPNRFMRATDALVLNYEYWSLDWLRSIKQVELAKRGDSEDRMLLGEYGLRAKNEIASGGIFDVEPPSP